MVCEICKRLCIIVGVLFERLTIRPNLVTFLHFTDFMWYCSLAAVHLNQLQVVKA